MEPATPGTLPQIASRRTALIALVVSCVLGGCAAPRGLVRERAAEEHNCPPERVEIVSADQFEERYVLDVCGNRRIYENLGADDADVYVDVTDDYHRDHED